jgi:phage replication O-like protein O
MANPQVENGHTQIANEILEQLIRLHLSPNQWQVLLCVIRKTYGYRKKVDYIANSQICEATRLGKSVVSRSLWLLEAMNLIIRKGKNIGFQKDWEKWRKLAKQSTKVSNIANNKELAESSTSATKLAEQLTIEKLAISSTELAESSTKVSSPVVAQKKKETKQKKNIPPTPLKEFSPEFQETFTRFIEMRKSLKKPMTDYAVKLALNKLKELASSEQEQIVIINQSIFHSWQGFFPLKDQGNQKSGGRIPPHYTDPAELEDKT